MFTTRIIRLTAFTLLCLGAIAMAQPNPGGAAPVPSAPSRIVAVTVYQNSALVTREVSVPENAGASELVVGPLPPSTISTSLYSEGADNIRVLTTRYRTRELQEVALEEQRKLESELKDLDRANQSLQRDMQVSQQNLQLMGKMEEFTSATLKQITDKGTLNPESITKIADYIMRTRELASHASVKTEQTMAANNERMQFLKREIARVSGAGDKTVREAVIVVDKAGSGPGTVKLNYLVSAASWRLQYRLRAAKDKPEASLEYLGAIRQQSGEDWGNVTLVLSVAEPMLNAAPPELKGLEVKPGGGETGRGSEAVFKGKAVQLRQQAVSSLNASKAADAGRYYNDAAAMEQAAEFMYAREERIDPNKASGPGTRREGQSVAFQLPAKLTIPWRDDEQLIEVTRVSLKPDYFYKAVPVLTEHVYRLADFTNDSQHVILPGEVTIYVGADFVGRTQLPLVAVGERFTAGFGVDPQLQVQRTLVEKSRSTQWGKEVLRFEYRITVSSYKSQPVRLQMWDRIPWSETKGIDITLSDVTPEASKDPVYVREEKPKNLLRWDLTIRPQTSGEQSTVLGYKFKMEVDKGIHVPSEPGPGGAPAPAVYDMRFEAL